MRDFYQVDFIFFRRHFHFFRRLAQIFRADCQRRTFQRMNQNLIIFPVFRVKCRLNRRRFFVLLELAHYFNQKTFAVHAITQARV